jgi:hypothetical protein
VRRIIIVTLRGQNMRKSTIARTAAATAFTALMLTAGLVRPSAATPVTWDFIETSCIASGGACSGGPGFLLATLALPDIYAAGTYSIHVPPGFPPGPPTETETGSPFTLNLGGLHVAPVPPTDPCITNPGGQPCDVSVNFGSSPAGLGIGVIWSEGGNFVDTVLSLQGSMARIGSDTPVLGCNASSVCTVTGSWELAAVPEPASSLALLLGALFLLQLGIKKAPQRG